ncbi:MAG: S8 family serine peptidase [Myxococcota bacterium]
MDSNADLEVLRSAFGLEVVADQDDGFVVAASDDSDLALLRTKVDEFRREVHGAGGVAKLHVLHDGEDQRLRLERILSEEMLEQWPSLLDTQTYDVDLGIETLGKVQVLPKVPERRTDDTDERRAGETQRDYEQRQKKWQKRLENWRRKKAIIEQSWDELRWERERQLIAMVEGYGGEVVSIIDGQPFDVARLSDSFTTRVRISGEGLRDIVLNFPYLFEVAAPEKLGSHERYTEPGARDLRVQLSAPASDAPIVCVVDSGIQQNHPLLERAILAEHSRCFLPGEAADNVADYVRPGGHGTRVAGAILFPSTIPTDGQLELPFWLLNARILNAENQLPAGLFPPALIARLVDHFAVGEKPCRIYNHSVAAAYPCRTALISAWASAIDIVSHERDVLFIQAVGNLPSDHSNPFRLGVVQHLEAGRPYPSYLQNASSRLPNPAQSFQALTVGSFAGVPFTDGSRNSLGREGGASAFSCSGPGMWGALKPDVVEFGGDDVTDNGSPPSVSNPPEVCPELVRSTLHAPGPLFDRDAVGTSFAAPKVAHIVASVARVLPEEPTLLYRALVAQSARWPAWSSDLSYDSRGILAKQIGYGQPNIERATSNSDFRVTLVTSGAQRVRAREAQIFEVPVPAELRRSDQEHEILIEITLSYSARVRRTRRRLSRYLSTHVDWTASKLLEPLDSFRGRVLKGSSRSAVAYDGIPWSMEKMPHHGTIRGVGRNKSTLQKDWAVVPSFALPRSFYVAVVGHPGWDRDPDAVASYSLAVSFESCGQELRIYEPIRVAVDALEVEASVEIEV